jgi:hypothetical protein
MSKSALLCLPALLIPLAIGAAQGLPEDHSAGHTVRGMKSKSKPFHAFPLRFDSESIRLTVVGDSLEVEGLYELFCRPADAPYAALLYPYPADSLLGAAHTLLLECRAAAGAWRPVEYEEIAGLHAVRWKVPLDLGARLTVRTIYRQALQSTYARYIVTTTQAWGEPLRRARFEIDLPARAEPRRFSFPFERKVVAGEVLYVYEAENFLPDRDILVEWDMP